MIESAKVWTHPFTIHRPKEEIETNESPIEALKY